MGSDKKKTEGAQDHGQEIDEPVSMYILFARMFSIIARRIEERLGDEGREIMVRSVQEFGEERGKDIARRARQKGNENDLQNYLVNNDMERSGLFGYENTYGEDEVRQEFDRCIFAETWMKEGQERYGRIYCENIDPSIARGYNERLVCEHDKMMYDDHKCTFCFKMK